MRSGTGALTPTLWELAITGKVPGAGADLEGPTQTAGDEDASSGAGIREEMAGQSSWGPQGALRRQRWESRSDGDGHGLLGWGRAQSRWLGRGV